MNNLKIPATIITGFLGSGKTTLIRHLLENARGKRIALIINEFGDLGIDRELLIGCGIEGCDDENLVELANGCICCTVADDFLPTMNKLLGRDELPEHIIIETSGLALPKPLVKAFNWPEVKSQVTVDGVIAVVDALAVFQGKFAHDPNAVNTMRELDKALDHDAPLEEVFEDQIMCADMILINKQDLLNEASILKVKAEIKEKIDPSVKIISTDYGVIDPSVLLGIGAAVEDVVEARKSIHDGEEGHDHDDFESFVIEINNITNPEQLEVRLRELVVEHQILRVKGFVNVQGKQMRNVIQCVGSRVHRYYDRLWREGENRRTALVIIGETGMDQNAIQHSLETL